MNQAAADPLGFMARVMPLRLGAVAAIGHGAPAAAAVAALIVEQPAAILRGAKAHPVLTRVREPSRAWLGRNAILNHALHGLTEPIDFAQCRVGIGRDADAVDVFVLDGGHHDPMVLEKILNELPAGNALDAHRCDAAGLGRVETRI